jgi:hypothetical protein
MPKPTHRSIPDSPRYRHRCRPWQRLIALIRPSQPVIGGLAEPKAPTLAIHCFEISTRWTNVGIAQRTKRAYVGAGICSVFTRSAAIYGMVANTLNTLSHGRATLPSARARLSSSSTGTQQVFFGE